ncbi:SCO3242 family prenyltransferase [Streptomyces sp. KLOTTS4A1]|uniref:SCO3242 family prenyltransferase n=1 Tax=Streptomyces sp. KLOTTS4A1 TaxID=3390996 RepID=UPI0039F59C9E
MTGATNRLANPAPLVTLAGGEALRSLEPVPPAQSRARVSDWAELLRVPALFTLPGDALAGAAASGARPRARTLLAITSSLCLYEAGMALNDWADRHVDAVERPHRPLPSGRITPVAALTAATGLTAAGLGLAALAGRRALTVAGALAGTVWAYDVALKNTPAAPLTMAVARSLDLLLGAVVTTGRIRPALPSAALLGAHTCSVTAVSRREAEGGSPFAPSAGLAVTAVLFRTLVHDRTPGAGTGPRGAERRPSDGLGAEPGRRDAAAPRGPDGLTAGRAITTALGPPGPSAATSLRAVLGAAYARTAAQPLFHAALNPSPQLTQRAVGGGIRAMIPLQAALAARSGRPGVALLTAALVPFARSFARKVSIT